MYSIGNEHTSIFICFVPLLVAVLLVINQLISVSHPDSEKVSPVECGFSPHWGRPALETNFAVNSSW